jgi:hypothetical protein
LITACGALGKGELLDAGAEKRKQFAALFDDAAKQKFDCVLFWALDRFSHKEMTQTIIYLQRLSMGHTRRVRGWL